VLVIALWNHIVAFFRQGSSNSGRYHQLPVHFDAHSTRIPITNDVPDRIPLVPNPIIEF